MSADLSSLPPECLATVLQRHADYRVLRRVKPMWRNVNPPVDADTLVGCAVALRATGSHEIGDRIVELAMQRFCADASGRIVSVGKLHDWVEDPGFGPSPERPVRQIREPMAAGLLMDADFVVAHDAALHRATLEGRLPIAAGRPWVCTLNDVDWRGFGIESRSLSDLLMRSGWFDDSDDAVGQISALLRLLDQPLGDGGTLLRLAVDVASKPTWLIEAMGAPYSADGRLRLRGYVWDGEGRRWFREVADDDLQTELRWATVHVYAGRARPTHRRVTWRERYGSS